MGTIKDKLQTALANKDAIKAALIAKGVENVDDVMSHYAGFIEAIQSGGGGDLDFTKIGYSGTPQYLIDGLAYAEKAQKAWDPSRTDITWKWNGQNELIFLPDIDLSSVTIAIGAFLNSGLEYIVTANFTNLEVAARLFEGCKHLRVVEKMCAPNLKDITSMFDGCALLENIEIDFSNVTKMNEYTFYSGMKNTIIRNLGKSELAQYNLNKLWYWSKGCVTKSLIDYSFNRASAGLPPAEIVLFQNVFNALTEDEKAQITAKGYTLVKSAT